MRTLTRARELWAKLDRPNVMIKIPATPAGIPAVQAAIADGINVNVTLMFSVDVYREVARAYVAGLRQRHERGDDISRISSVASFFVSRVDSKIDKALTEAGGRAELEARGRAAIANAKLAYEAFDEIFGGDEFADLRAAGANVQRCLWASTSTKNPDYRDVLYVEELIGPDTVDTMPLGHDRGLPRPREPSSARWTGTSTVPARRCARSRPAGSAWTRVTEELLAEGVASFGEELRRAHRDDRVEAEGARPGMSDLDAAIAARLESFTADQRRRSAVGEATARCGPPPASRPRRSPPGSAGSTLPDAMSRARRPSSSTSRATCARTAIGASPCSAWAARSLAPELFARVFGWAGGPAGTGAASADGLELRILDSTHPDVVRGFRSWASAQRTLFCVSSKSGTTTEPNAYQAAMGEIAPALDFVAITDPDTALAELARAQEFRAIVTAPPDVGGRYSALTVFGLVPAALNGVDVGGAARRGRARMAEACRTASASANPGLALGAHLGRSGAGRPRQAHLPDLAAARRPSATGPSSSSPRAPARPARGIVPIVGEAPMAAEAYAGRSLLRPADLRRGHRSRAPFAWPMASMARGHPVTRIDLADPLDVGAEFVRWEVATAAAGIVLGIDPFDQPNVQESKDATKDAARGVSVAGGALPAADAAGERAGHGGQRRSRGLSATRR